MQNKQSVPKILGLDLGHINTRASLFNAIKGKYYLLDAESRPTSIGMNLGSGVGSAIRAVQHATDHELLKPGSGLIMPSLSPNQGVDHFALAVSEGEHIRSVLLGLSDGSLSAGQALVDSLPLDVILKLSTADLLKQGKVIDQLIKTRPELFLLVGGVELGIEGPIKQWVEIIRLILRILPESAKPQIVYTGNTALQSYVSRRLEPLTKIYNLPNLFPQLDRLDLTPVQEQLNQIILQIWENQMAGFSELAALSRGLKSTVGFAIHRMVRHLGEMKSVSPLSAHTGGVIALNLGGGETLLSVKQGGRAGMVLQKAWPEQLDRLDHKGVDFIYHWTGVEIRKEEVWKYLANYALNPHLIPENKKELAIHHALARYRIWQAVEKFSQNHEWFGLSQKTGLKEFNQTIYVSGAVLTRAPQAGQTMLMLLDGLQPKGITKFFLDRYHLLPLLGIMAEIDPVLSVHLINSDAFSLLGTVISPVSDAPLGKKIMKIRVTPDTGKNYVIDIIQGEMKHLVIPAGNAAVFEIEPDPKTQVGFGEPGEGGYFRVSSGPLGVVIDARGRPIQLPPDDSESIRQHQQWLGILGV